MAINSFLSQTHAKMPSDSYIICPTDDESIVLNPTMDVIATCKGWRVKKPDRFMYFNRIINDPMHFGTLVKVDDTWYNLDEAIDDLWRNPCWELSNGRSDGRVYHWMLTNIEAMCQGWYFHKSYMYRARFFIGELHYNLHTEVMHAFKEHAIGNDDDAVLYRENHTVIDLTDDISDADSIGTIDLTDFPSDEIDALLNETVNADDIWNEGLLEPLDLGNL